MLTVVRVVPTLRGPTFQLRSVPMTPADFILARFYRIDHPKRDVPKHPQAFLYSAVVPLGVLYALKGGRKRAFYRWLVRDW